MAEAPTEAALRLPVNKLAVNLPPKRVDHGYLKVLIVAEALVSEVLGNFFAMPDRFCIEFDSNCIPMRDAIFHIEEKLLYAITSQDPNPMCQDWFRANSARRPVIRSAVVTGWSILLTSLACTT
jgi:hypothetical protein